MGKNIFNISIEYVNLMNEIEEADGLLTEETEKRLRINEEDLENKLKSYYYLIQTTKGSITTIDDEIERLKVAKSIKANIINKLKSNVKDAVILFGDDGKSGNKVIKYDNIKFYTRKNEQVHFEDEDSFYNTDYVDYKITEKLTDTEFNLILKTLKVKPEDLKYNVVINKINLKSDLKNKVEIDGVSLVRNDSIIIK